MGKVVRKRKPAEPPATVLAFGARDPDALDIFAVGERLAAEGWYLDRQNRPDSLHATVHAGSAATVPSLVTDLRRAVKEVGSSRTEQRDTTYGQGDSRFPADADG